MSFICNNQIGDNGIEHLSKALPKMKALNELNLDNNQIGDNGIEHLSKALPKMKQQMSLHLDESIE